MTKEEAMKLALEALEYIDLVDNDRDFLQPHECYMLDEAMTALRQVLRRTVANEALDKMAENARELGLDYEPAQQEPVAYGMWDTMLGKGNRMMMVRLDKGQDGCTVPLYTSPSAQQEPVAWICYGAPGKRDIDFDEADINDLPIGTLLYTSPPAQQESLTFDGMTAQEFALKELYAFQEATGCDTADQIKAREPLTEEQINLLINSRGDEDDDDYVEPTGDGFGLTDADLVKLVRRVEAHYGIKGDA